MDHSDRGLRFVKLDTTTLRLLVFPYAAFANNQDLSSQTGYVVVLADAMNRAYTTLQAYQTHSVPTVLRLNPSV